MRYDFTPPIAEEGEYVLPTKIGKHWFPSQGMYNIPDRDKTRTKFDKRLIGTRMLCNRIVVRCGYLWEYMDFQFEHMVPLIHRLVDLRLKVAFKESGLDPELVNNRLVSNMRELFNVDNTVMYDARSLAVGAAYRKVKEETGKDFHNLRTFWYHDLDEDHLVTTLKVISHQIGTHYPATGGYDAPWGYEDYEPAGLDGHYQESVLCRFDAPMMLASSKYDRLFFADHIEVHPADLYPRSISLKSITEIEEKTNEPTATQ